MRARQRGERADGVMGCAAEKDRWAGMGTHGPGRVSFLFIFLFSFLFIFFFSFFPNSRLQVQIKFSFCCKFTLRINIHFKHTHVERIYSFIMLCNTLSFLF
jgi:hypothetical protein